MKINSKLCPMVMDQWVDADKYEQENNLYKGPWFYLITKFNTVLIQCLKIADEWRGKTILNTCENSSPIHNCHYNTVY